MSSASQTDGRAGQARTNTPVDRAASIFPFLGKASGLDEAGTIRDESVRAIGAGSPGL